MYFKELPGCVDPTTSSEAPLKFCFASASSNFACVSSLSRYFPGPVILLALSATSQAMPQGTTKRGVEQQGFTWTETYEGSGNSDGFITDINSTIGYSFGKHFAMVWAHRVSSSSRLPRRRAPLPRMAWEIRTWDSDIRRKGLL